MPFLGHELRAETPDGFVGGLFFEVHFPGFGNEGAAYFGESGGGGQQFREARFHALQGPKKIYGRGARFRKLSRDLRKFRFQFIHGSGARVEHTEGHAHRRRDTDGRRAANHHVANGFGDLAVVRVGVIDLLGGKAALVQHDYAAFGPLDGLGYVHSSVLPLLEEL